MRGGWWMAAVLALLPHGVRAAEPPVMLGTNPSECEISRALLGSAPPGCPPSPVVVPAVPAPPAVLPPPAVVLPAPTAAAPAAPAPPPAATRVERKAAFLINFDFGSARIQSESTAVLDRVAAVMTAAGAGEVRFRIVGHTDDVGSDATNLDLSRRRAAAVKDYLVRRHKVAAGRLDAVGIGKREPFDRANPRAAENRRVEIVALGG